MDEFEPELTKLPLRTRVAFAAACADRVLVVYKYTVPGDVIFRGPTLAVHTAWSFAEGIPVDEKQIQSAKVELDRAFPAADLGGGANHFACSSAAYALDAIKDDTPKSACLAAGRARDAIAQVDEEQGEAEEKAWQLRALQLIQEWGDRPIRRTMFEELGTDKPSWLERIE